MELKLLHELLYTCTSTLSQYIYTHVYYTYIIQMVIRPQQSSTAGNNERSSESAWLQISWAHRQRWISDVSMRSAPVRIYRWFIYVAATKRCYENLRRTFLEQQAGKEEFVEQQSKRRKYRSHCERVMYFTNESLDVTYSNKLLEIPSTYWSGGQGWDGEMEISITGIYDWGIWRSRQP